uniref:Histone deacetylase complex subunit SAP30 Sin3 binding domain-containing protein n=1 Tax=Aegilops tauschii subsp. strangulata TaxID=200361 RepID=A0A452XBE6_AEGTS
MFVARMHYINCLSVKKLNVFFLCVLLTASIEYQKPTKPRVRHTRPWSSCTTTSSSRANLQSTSKLRARVNLTKLGTPTLWRYWKHFNLVSMNPTPSEEQLFHGVQQHFQSQQLDELQVILGFIQTAKRLKTLYKNSS